MLKAHEGAEVDIVDRLPTPFGLVRFGVASNHPETKKTCNRLPSTNFSGLRIMNGAHSLGMSLLDYISLPELHQIYHVVRLYLLMVLKVIVFGIPGEELKGVHSARELVWWYNEHPDFSKFTPNLKSTVTAIVLGQGNVARILLRPPKELATTDIATHALEVLRESSISKFVVEKPTVKSNEPKTVKKENEALIIEDWMSENEEEGEPKLQTVKPNFTKIEFYKPKTTKKPVEQIRKDTYISPRGNKRNWDQQMSQKLKSGFEMLNKACYVCDYEAIDGGFVAIGGTKFNLFSVSQMYDKKNSVLFTDTACVVLSPAFKLTYESHVLLKVPIKDNMYIVVLKNVVPQGGIENLIDLRVKVIRCDNRTEFKNMVMNQFYEMKYIKREFSVARTPWQNKIAERKNKTLIEATRTMLADSKLPTTFWAEAVNTAFHVQNRVLVIKPHNKTPYELYLCRKPTLSFMRPFGCPVIILNTIDHLDALTKSMNYKPFVAGNQSNGSADFSWCWIQTIKKEENNDAEDLGNENSEDNVVHENIVYGCTDDPNMPELEEIGRFGNAENMDMKSALLYGKIEKEVYVCQPSRFEDPDFPGRVYKIEKALYRLHQALELGMKPCQLICWTMGFREVFRYVKGQPVLGLWYPKDSPFDLVAYTNSDYARESLDRKSITRGCQFLGCRLISWQCKKQNVVANSITKAEYIAASWIDGLSKHNAIYLIPSHIKKIFSNMKRVGKDISKKETPLFPTMMVHAQKDIGEVLVIPIDPRHTPTITQPSTSKPQKKQKPRKQRRHDIKETHPSSLGDNVAYEAFNAENVSQHSNDPLLNETTKTNQAMEIDNLKRSVKKLEKKQSLGEEDASKHWRNIADIDVDAEITLVDETAEDQGRFDDQEMFDTGVFDEEEVVVEQSIIDKEVSAVKDVNASQDQVSAATNTTADVTPDELTAAQALVEKKNQNPRLIRAGEEIEQESSKRQKVDDNQETVKFKRCLEIVPNDGDDVTIDATSLSSKSPTIGSDDEPEEPEEAPSSLDYMPGPEHPPSPNYMPSPENPPSLVYVPEPEYPEYLVPSNAEVEVEEHLAPDDSSIIPVDDPISSAQDTKAFKTDESAPTPSSSRPHRASIFVRLPSPTATSLEIPSPPLLIPSPPLPLPSPPTTSPSYAEITLGYRAVGIWLRAASPPQLLPSTSHRTDIPKAEMPPQKRACFTAATSRENIKTKIIYKIDPNDLDSVVVPSVGNECGVDEDGCATTFTAVRESAKGFSSKRSDTFLTNTCMNHFRLEVDVRDDSAHTIVVMFDDMAKVLTKSCTKALLEGLDENFTLLVDKPPNEHGE
nr:hypothetical protein [Tanacetum cinerariifolium]